MLRLPVSLDVELLEYRHSRKTDETLSLPMTLGKQILLSPDRIETTVFTVNLATLA